MILAALWDTMVAAKRFASRGLRVVHVNWGMVTTASCISNVGCRLVKVFGTH